MLDRAPLGLAALYALAGSASYITYWWDKRAAGSGRWRRSEMALHGLDFAFGIIGGLLAQQVLRHKTSKPGFAMSSYAIAFLHALVLVGLLLDILSLADIAAPLVG